MSTHIRSSISEAQHLMHDAHDAGITANTDLLTCKLRGIGNLFCAGLLSGRLVDKGRVIVNHIAE